MTRLDKAPRGLPGALAAASTPDLRVMHPSPPVAVTQTPADLRSEPVVTRRKQGGYYAHDADIDRARAAWKHTELEPLGYSSWSDFQLAAVMMLTEHMEQQYNRGKPFPPLPAGQVKHSRRSDS